MKPEIALKYFKKNKDVPIPIFKNDNNVYVNEQQNMIFDFTKKEIEMLKLIIKALNSGELNENNYSDLTNF